MLNPEIQEEWPPDETLFRKDELLAALAERLGPSPESIVQGGNLAFADISKSVFGADHLLTKTYKEAAESERVAAYVAACREVIRTYRLTREQIYKLLFPDLSLPDLPEWMLRSADEKLLRNAMQYDISYDHKARFAFALTFFRSYPETRTDTPVSLTSRHRRSGEGQNINLGPFTQSYLNFSLAEAQISHWNKGDLYPGSPPIFFLISQNDEWGVLPLWENEGGDGRLARILRPGGLLSQEAQTALADLPYIVLTDGYPGMGMETGDVINPRTYNLVSNINLLFPDVLPYSNNTWTYMVGGWAHEIDHLIQTLVFGKAGSRFASSSLLELSAEAAHYLCLLRVGASKEEIERLCRYDMGRTEYQRILEDDRTGHNYELLFDGAFDMIRGMSQETWSKFRRDIGG